MIYEIMDVPVETPVTTPELLPTVAIAEDDVQVPPEVALANDKVEPTHTYIDGPVMAAGLAVTTAVPVAESVVAEGVQVAMIR